MGKNNSKGKRVLQIQITLEDPLRSKVNSLNNNASYYCSCGIEILVSGANN